MSRMEVKVLCRNPRDYVRQRASDIHKLPRNLDPSQHPLEGPREYVRALNATKLERVFAKPFVGNLAGHADGVYALCKHPKKLSILLSGSCDGEVRIWDLSGRQCLINILAHSRFVRGVCMDPAGNNFITVGEDKIIKQWRYEEEGGEAGEREPVSTILGKTIYQGIDHHCSDPVFATCGDRVDVWDESRSEPIRSYTWGSDSVTNLRFNPIETNILAVAASDRAVVLYDVRQPTPLRKVVMRMRSNGISWNPMEALNFTVANEDSNLYTFDMRRLDQCSVVHKGHVMAVLDVDHSPTGTEFVSGSFDKTVRIFGSCSGHSRDVYHTKRMQRVFCVRWSSDATYVVSGSDETNIRLWKAHSSQKLGNVSRREKVSLDYASRLRERYQHHPQVRRIARHRHIPRPIYTMNRERRIMLEARRRKKRNIALHSKPGAVAQTREKEKSIIEVLE